MGEEEEESNCLALRQQLKAVHLFALHSISRIAILSLYQSDMCFKRLREKMLLERLDGWVLQDKEAEIFNMWLGFGHFPGPFKGAEEGGLTNLQFWPSASPFT